MTEQRRRVTRGYVGGLLGAVLVVALALIITTWGLLSLLGDTAPVTTPDIAKWIAPLAVVFVLGMLAWGLWQQALILLRGRRAPSWALIIALGGAGYLVWCLVGTLGGLSVSETWTSIFAVTLIPIVLVASVIFWAVLMRRVYTDRAVPQWPWEKREAREREEEERRAAEEGWDGDDGGR